MTTPLQNLTTANYPGGTQDFYPSRANALTDAQLAAVQALVSGAGKGLIRIGGLSRIQAAIAAATPAAPVTIARVGNSVTAGAGSGISTTWDQAVYRNCSAQFAALTNGAVLYDSQIGDGHIGLAPSGYSVYNPQVTFPMGTTGLQFITNTLGGYCFRFDAGATGSMRYTFKAGTTKIRFIWLSLANITVKDDLGVITTLVSPGGNTLVFSDFVPRTGTTYIEVYGNSSTWLHLGWIAYNGIAKVSLLNCGMNGQKMSDYSASTNYYDAANALAALSPKMVVVCGSINDALSATLKLTFRQQMVPYIEGILKYADVVLEIEPISNDASSTSGALWDVQNSMLELAQTYNLTVMSWPGMNGGFSQANTAGLMFDYAHPSYAGHGADAQMWLGLWNYIKG